MEKVLKIIKINLLALVAIPLLLLATAFKLIAKAFEKFTLFLALIAVATVASLLTYAFVSSPGGFFTGIVAIAVAIVLFGIFVAILLWIISIIAGLAAAAWGIVISVLNFLYEVTYTAYLNLFTICEADYKIISLNDKKILNAVCCLFFTILRGLSRLITTVMTVALYLGIAASLFVIIEPIWELNQNTSRAFGMNIMEFLKKCSTSSAVAGILLYLVFTGVTVVAIMALAIEWLEWGRELKSTGQEISSEITNVIDSQLRIASGTAEEIEKNKNYVAEIQEHIDGLNELGDKVTAVLDKKDNPLLRSYWGTYMRNLSPIVEECSNEKGISGDRFKQLIPQIQLLDRQRNDVQKLLAKLEAELSNPAGSSTFFVGCDTPEKLEKRYKSLCKTYHPDSAEGDTTTFQIMKQEYESIKSTMS